MEVEVVFPRVCGAFYQAFLEDIQLENGKASLSFPRDWKPPVWTDLSYIRLPIEQNASGLHENFSIGTKVEALLPHHDNEPAGWWTGTLLKSRGELHVVEFQSGSEKYQDIVDHDKLRAPNINLPLSKMKLFKKEFPVSDELGDYCQRRGVHENFRSKIKAVCVSYNRNDRIFTVLASNELCLDRASLLIEMHFRDLRTQKSLLTKNELAAQKYHHQNHHAVTSSGGLEVRFHVPSDLVGMAIGREGANVNEARRIRGVSSVEFDDYSSMFSVKGENEEALKKARERLEFGREMMLIPRNLAGKVIGKKGNVIQEILEKSRVHNVKVVGDDEAKDRDIDIQVQVPFDFIGRKSDIDNAKMMMEYHLEHLKSVEKILQSHRDLENEHQLPNNEENFFPAPLTFRGSGRGRGRPGPYRSGSGNRARQRESQTTEEESSPLLPPHSPAHHEHRSESKRSEEERSNTEDSDSDSNHGSEQDVWRSGPEDDEQGPDRRRPPPSSRGQGGRRGGGGGGGGGGGLARGGRGSRGGRGYRNQRQGRSGGNRYGVSASRSAPGGGGGGGGGGGEGGLGSTSGDLTEPRLQTAPAGHSGSQEGDSLPPRPQRQGRGRQRGRGRSSNNRTEEATAPQQQQEQETPSNTVAEDRVQPRAEPST